MKQRGLDTNNNLIGATPPSDQNAGRAISSVAGQPSSCTATIAAAAVSGAPARVTPFSRAGAHVDVPPDRAWLTAAEGAAEKLVGFAISERAIRTMLAQGEIASRRQSGGIGRKGREFHWTSLPREARAEYLRRYGVAETGTTLATVSPEARATEKDLRAATRLKIARAAADYVARSKRTKARALESFCELYNARRLRGFEPIDLQVEPTIRPDHLRTWDRTVRVKGEGALIDGRGRPAGTGFFDRPENIRARNYVIARLAANGKLTAADICTDLEADEGVIIQKRTMQKFLSNVRAANPALLKALHNPDQHRSHHRPAFGSRDVPGINQRWELDATVADAMCLMPDGTQRRMKLTGVIDVGTRRAMVLVSDQPRAVATQALLRRAIMEWGVPAEVKTDNGKEFSNRAVELFCAAAGVALSFSRPFHPEEKPHIERFYGTLNKGFFPGLQGYVGANITERTAIRSRNSFAHRFGDEARLTFGVSLSPEGLQARIDAWCRDLYEQRPHAGLQQRGGTPAQVALLQADQVKRLPDDRALDQLLLPLAGTRNVLKKGISVAKRWYIAPELGAIMGQQVTIRRDPHDVGRIFVYSVRGDSFVCIAEDPELTGGNRIQIALGAQRAQRELVNRVREEVRNVHRLYPPGSAQDRRLLRLSDDGQGFPLLPDAAEGMEAAQTTRLLAATDAANAAEQHGQPDQPVAATAEQVETAKAMISDMSAKLPVPQRMIQCTGYQRPFFENDVDFWLWAKAHQAAGLQLDGPDTEQIAELKASPVFKQQLKARGTA